MKILLEIMFLITVSIASCRFWYMEGYNDANFDRDAANFRLQQCIEVITK